MSAFLSAVAPEGAALLTDGACRHGKILVEDKRKVFVGDGVAITGRGHSHVLDQLGAWFIEWADEIGPAGAIERLQYFADMVEANHDPEDGHFELNVVAFVPGIGGAHRFFQASPMRYCNEDIPAFGVVRPGDVGWRPLRLETDQFGLLARRPGERLKEWACRAGVGFMQHMRDRPIDARDVEGEFFSIGGHVDLTMLAAEGVTVEKIIDWADPLGQEINPFRMAA